LDDPELRALPDRPGARRGGIRQMGDRFRKIFKRTVEANGE
jgi:hypothetical protein